MFPVEIWGTVAAWTGVATTGGAAALAAWYYVNDKRLEAKAQARQIRVLLKEQIPRFTVTVFNYSDRAIYDVVVETQPMTVMETLVYRKTAVNDAASGKATHPTAKVFAALQEMFSKADAPSRTVLMENDRALRPGDKADISYDNPENPASRYSVVFRDYMSRRWRIEYWTDAGELHTRLTHTSDKQMPKNAWDLARHPIRDRMFIRRWLTVWWWQKRNPPGYDEEAAPHATDDGNEG